MIHPVVTQLLKECPFLRGQLDEDHFDLPTVVFGEVARLLTERKLRPEQEDSVFGFLNALAESPDGELLDILGTGAIESFNDNPASQRLARAKLTGRALAMLEDFRMFWGQPDYRDAS
jgi:hypothetical protein